MAPPRARKGTPESVTDEGTQDATDTNSPDPAQSPAEPENAPQGPILAPEDQLPNVHQAIADAMRRMRAVGKLGQNKQDGYAFKRIDDFMTAAHAGLSAAGVHIVPRVLQRMTDESHQTRSGNVMRWVDMEVAFDFHGPRGDSVTVVTWGEGRDASDKATNKALTAAMKYALMYALMVPTSDIQDADRDSPEAGNAQQGNPEQERLNREHQERLAAEQEARRAEFARAIATATATPDVVLDLRADVLGYADAISAALPRKEQLQATWREAAGKGALGCEVRLPDSWRAHTNGPEVCTLHQLIEGAQDVNLPPSGEGVPEAQELPTDPWATGEGQTSE